MRIQILILGYNYKGLTLTFLSFFAFSREEYVLLGLYSTALVSLLPGYNVLYSLRYFAI